MTERQQLDEFTRRACHAVEYSEQELDLTLEQMIGVIEVAKQMLVERFLHEPR